MRRRQQGRGVQRVGRLAPGQIILRERARAWLSVASSGTGGGDLGCTGGFGANIVGKRLAGRQRSWFNMETAVIALDTDRAPGWSR